MSNLDIDLRVLAASIVVHDVLPAGEGVRDSEVGTPGPWYGIRFADGTERGWGREPVLLGSLVRPTADDYRAFITREVKP